MNSTPSVVPLAAGIRGSARIAILNRRTPKNRNGPNNSYQRIMRAEREHCETREAAFNNTYRELNDCFIVNIFSTSNTSPNSLHVIAGA